VSLCLQRLSIILLISVVHVENETFHPRIILRLLRNSSKLPPHELMSLLRRPLNIGFRIEHHRFFHVAALVLGLHIVAVFETNLPIAVFLKHLFESLGTGLVLVGFLLFERLSSEVSG